MKRFTLPVLAALALLAAPAARAWNYNPGDLLLVFRNGSQDVEFDLGSVTNYLGHTNGYTITVPGWDPGLVTSTFGSFNGLKVVLLATSGGTNWLSSAEPNFTAYNISSQAAQTLGNAIGAVGSKPLFPLAIPTAETNAYSIDIGGQYGHSSYDYVVSGGQFSGVPQLGGDAQFKVEQSIPGLLDFWAIQSTTVYPNSPPDAFIGTFTINASGVLKFVAGPRAATVTGVTHAGSVSAIQFTTIVGKTYSLSYTNKFGGAVSNWPVDVNTVIGDGHADTIYHTNTSAAEFFRLRTQ